MRNVNLTVLLACVGLALSVSPRASADTELCTAGQTLYSAKAEITIPRNQLPAFQGSLREYAKQNHLSLFPSAIPTEAVEPGRINLILQGNTLNGIHIWNVEKYGAVFAQINACGNYDFSPRWQAFLKFVAAFQSLHKS